MKDGRSAARSSRTSRSGGRRSHGESASGRSRRDQRVLVDEASESALEYSDNSYHEGLKSDPKASEIMQMAQQGITPSAADQTYYAAECARLQATRDMEELRIAKEYLDMYFTYCKTSAPPPLRIKSHINTALENCYPGMGTQFEHLSTWDGCHVEVVADGRLIIERITST